MTRSVGIVVPAFRPDVDRLTSYVRALDERLDPDVVRIELDAPRPGVLDRLASLPAEVNAVPRRRGKGAAVTAGFEALETDVLAFVDADGSTPPASVDDVLAPVVDARADLAAGSRRHPDATIRSHQTFARRRLGDVFAWFARRLLDVRLYDYQCGAKALTSEVWSDVRRHLYEPGFAWDLEVLVAAEALGYRIVEVPVVWEDQPGSTVSPVGASIRLGRGLLVSRHRGKTLRADPLHSFIGSDRRPTLVDRLAAEVADE